MLNHCSKKSGFTLVEVVVVVAIMGVLSTMGVSSLRSAVINTRMKDYSLNLTAFLERIGNDATRMSKEFCVKMADGKRAEKIIKVEYAFQDLNDLPEGFKCPEGREKPWGTAHAIYAARDLIREDFIVINGDDFYGKETYEVAYKYLADLPKDSKGKYAIVAFQAKNTMTENGAVKRGVAFEDKNGYLEKLIESSIYAKWFDGLKDVEAKARNEQIGGHKA